MFENEFKFHLSALSAVDLNLIMYYMILGKYFPIPGLNLSMMIKYNTTACHKFPLQWMG